MFVRQPRPTIAELLDELNELHKSEAVEIEAPMRQDRPNAMLEPVNEATNSLCEANLL